MSTVHCRPAQWIARTVYPPGTEEQSAQAVPTEPETTRQDPFAQQFLQHIEASSLTPAGSRILVALSGGLDSTALLHLLRFHATVAGYDLVAAHFDHRMRENSAADADWVRGLCRAWHVRLESVRATAVPRSEAAARTARYAFLHEAAERVAADRIATAHHADDQAETVLFRLLRGGGGLQGIPARRGIVVRPLLPFRRQTISAYATRFGLTHVEDPTNLDMRWTRNRIRHIALPAIERAVPGSTARLLSLSRAASEAESAWRTIVEDAIQTVVVDRYGGSIRVARTPLLGYHRHVRGRVLRRLVGEYGRTPGRAGTRAALAFIRTGTSGTGIELVGGLRLERHFDHFIIGPRRRQGGADDRVLEIAGPTNGSGTARLGGQLFSAQWSCKATDARLAVTFDPTALRFPIELRAWRAGDRIRLACGSKKLKKLFLERRVPRYARDRVPILAQSDDRILWVAGVARVDGAEPKPGGQVFEIRVMHGNDR